MAEDQSVNGGIWNKQAAQLLSFYKWETIGDVDMDVQGSDEKMYGVDTLMKFTSPLTNNPQSVILEAKRYLTTSFSPKLLQSWIDRLDKKLLTLKNSVEFTDQFPDLKECSTLNVGVIAIWFHDIQKYSDFHETFIEAMRNVKTSNRTRKGASYNKIYVIDNSIILKLSSLHKAVTDYETETQSKIEFYYPSAFIEDKPIIRKKTLTPEYIFSKVILAETKGQTKNENIVFYFGELDLGSFKQLRNLLSICSFLDENKQITLFTYQYNDDFRKIKPDVEKIFADITFKIKSMDNLIDLPASIKDIE